MNNDDELKEKILKKLVDPVARCMTQMQKDLRSGSAHEDLKKYMTLDSRERSAVFAKMCAQTVDQIRASINLLTDSLEDEEMMDRIADPATLMVFISGAVLMCSRQLVQITAQNILARTLYSGGVIPSDVAEIIMNHIESAPVENPYYGVWSRMLKDLVEASGLDKVVQPAEGDYLGNMKGEKGGLPETSEEFEEAFQEILSMINKQPPTNGESNE